MAARRIGGVSHVLGHFAVLIPHDASVPGALTAGDLCDLAGSLGGKKAVAESSGSFPVSGVPGVRYGAMATEVATGMATELGNMRDTHPSNLWTDVTVPFWSMPENTDHPTQKAEKLVAKAAPDGYTVLITTNTTQSAAPHLYKKLSYDPVKDFIPITLGGRIPFILVVTPSLPVHSVAELVAYAKDNPGKLSFASGGPGSPHHLYGELLKSMTGIEMTHVPYKGSAPALTDVIAGHVPLLFSDTVPSLPQIRVAGSKFRGSE